MSKEQELTKGQRSYLKRIINELQKDAEELFNKIESQNSKNFDELLSEKKGLITEIETLKSKITDVEKAKEELESRIHSTIDLHEQVFEEDENGYSMSSEIQGFTEEFKEYKNQIIGIKSEIDNYSNKLFGYEDEDGNLIKGIDHKIESLKSELQSSIKETQEKLNTFIEENTTKQEDLLEKIESLLKGASTVALAHAFNQHKESFKTTNRIWMGLFVFSIVSLMGISVWGFINANYEFKDMWKYTIGNIPFVAGAVWLAIYASKQRSQNKRLQQEYAYKEDIAKVYYGLKEEIKELPESESQNELKENMLKLVLDVIGQNPSETLESSIHDDRGPTGDILNILKESLSKKGL